MRVPYGEELAIHTGLEPCVDSRKVTCEALTGGVRAGLLSRERYGKLQGADAVHKVEGNTGCRRTDVATLRREPGGKPSGSIGEAATRGVPSKAGQEDLHTQKGW